MSADGDYQQQVAFQGKASAELDKYPKMGYVPSRNQPAPGQGLNAYYTPGPQGPYQRGMFPPGQYPPGQYPPQYPPQGPSGGH